MSSYDTAGQISKQTFIVSSALLLGISLFGILGRFCVRLRIQKQLSIDDGLLILGTCCMVCSFVLTLTAIDTMYMLETLTLGENIAFTMPPDFHDRINYYRNTNNASLILTWFTIVSVKFSFLALFRKLIDRIHVLIVYWWVVVVFNGVVSVYGATVPALACPLVANGASASCMRTPGLRSRLNLLLSPLILDIIGDLLILVIPVRLIWQIRTKWTQKLALACSLCLTLVMIIFTVIRASGIGWHGRLDEVWVTFWQLLAAEMGLVLASVSTFRALYVSRTKESQGRKVEKITLGSHSKMILKRLHRPRVWYATGRSSGPDKADINEPLSVDDCGSTSILGSRAMQSINPIEGREDQWPLPNKPDATHV